MSPAETPRGPVVLDGRAALGLLRRYWPLLVVGTLLGGLVAYGWTLTRPEVYAADAAGLVSPKPSETAGDSAVGDDVAKGRATAYVALANGRSVADRAAQALGSGASPAALAGRVSVSRTPGTALIRITATASQAQAAKQLADAWVEALSAEITELEDSRTTGTGFLTLVPIESAVAPGAPISPDPQRNIVLGLGIGLLAGALLALARYRLDRRIHTAADLAPFGVTVAGELPLSPTGGLVRHGRTDEAPADDSTRALAEAVRKLRTNLHFMNIDDPPRIIVVTSPLPGDGKSTIAANVALAIAASEQPVVLIDADLRRPVQAEAFGLPEGAGLTDVLIGRATFEEMAQRPDGIADLQVLGAGRVPPNPSELLGSATMGKLLAELASEAIVIVDAPPLLPVTDAAVLTANADGALIVVSAGTTLDVQLEEAMANLDAVNGRVLGLVLNKARQAADKYGYYGDVPDAPRRRWPLMR